MAARIKRGVKTRKVVHKKETPEHKKKDKVFFFFGKKTRNKEKIKPVKTHKKKLILKKVHKPKTTNKLLKMYFISFIILTALIIWAYFYEKWIVAIIGSGLIFFTLLFYTIIKHKKQNKLVPIKKIEKKHEIKKEIPPLNKLIEKEKILEIIKLKRKVTLYLFLFLFSLIPILFGYNNMHWITLSLGLLLTTLSIFGLFHALTKLKSVTKPKLKPQRPEKKEIIEKEVKINKKPEKKIPKDKNRLFRKLRFIAIIVFLIAIVNAFIFFLPSFALWIYIIIGAGTILILLVLLFIFKRKPREKAREEIKKEVKEKEPFVDEDVKKVLQITDELLGNLPDEKIAEFSRSKDFGLYERVLNKYKIK